MQDVLVQVLVNYVKNNPELLEKVATALLNAFVEHLNSKKVTPA